MERWQYDRDLISWNWLSKSKYIISSNIAFNLFQKDKLILKQKQNKNSIKPLHTVTPNLHTPSAFCVQKEHLLRTCCVSLYALEKVQTTTDGGKFTCKLVVVRVCVGLGRQFGRRLLLPPHPSSVVIVHHHVLLLGDFLLQSILEKMKWSLRMRKECEEY